MRIGIDATCWANERGYGRFTREMVSAMVSLAPTHEFVCLLDARAAARFSLDAPNVYAVVVDQDVSPTLAASSGDRRSPRDMLRMTQAVRRAAVDVFYSPSVYGYFPLPPGLPAVVTVHDAIAERFPELTLPTRRDRFFWKAKVRLALRQARIVLTVSDYAAGEIEAMLRVPRAQMRVTLEGVAAAYRPSEGPEDIAAAAARVGIPAGARWLMYVGGFGPHKRVDALVRAHGRVAARQTASLVLVLVGPNDDAFHQDLVGIRAAIEESGTAELVKWAGYLPDDEVRHLHSGAVALVLPSVAEGFGLPAVEAARCGTPVVATTASPLPQVLEGGGLFVRPDDPRALDAALEHLLTDEAGRQAMGRRALERASALSWPRSAKVALDALEEAALPRRGRRAV